jgi:hydrogenase maturation protease
VENRSGFRIQDSGVRRDAGPTVAGLNPESRILNPTLLIGYGNGLRGDDAIGIVIAEAVEAWNLPGVEVIACHQLTPELSDPISRASLVIFVDAAATGTPGDLSVTPVEPADPTSSSAHGGDPGKLLGLAQTVFGTCPPAWYVTVVAEDMSFREGLTETARRGVEEALVRIRELIKTN